MAHNTIINTTKPYLPPFDEYVEAIRPLWESHMITNMAAYHNILEEKLKNYLNVPGFLLFSNGHTALELTLHAMNLQGEVITTPFTFASTTHAIVRNGLMPVFCDIDSKDFTIDTEQIESLITPSTSAIVGVHVYGSLCNVEKIQKIADKHHLKVIYDAAHAFGITKDGIGIGTFGDASVFSFHATKSFHTVEGGGVSFRDKNIGCMLYALKNFGLLGEGFVPEIGVNGKMNELQAIMGLCNLNHYSEVVERRKRRFQQYIEELKEIPGLQFMRISDQVQHNYTYFPLVVDKEQYGMDRDTLCNELNRQEIYPRKYFYPLTSEFACYQGRFDSSKTPVAKRISHEILTLPLYDSLVEEEVSRICRIIKEEHLK